MLNFIRLNIINLLHITSVIALISLMACGGSSGDGDSEEDGEDPVNNFNLSVNVTGEGSVSVTGQSNACSAQCTYSFAENTVVTLTPTAADGYVFRNWSGACSGTDSCNVTLSSNLAVEAVFEQVEVTSFALTLDVSGNGVITSSPTGINCGNGATECNANFDQGDSVSLSQSSASGYVFSGWSGACSGDGQCVVEMSQAQNVSANFIEESVIQYTLDVVVEGEGSVTSSPAGIDCGSDCSQVFEENQAVVLTATSQPNYVFSNWSGACSGTGNCNIVMTQAQNVTANFTAESNDQVTLDVTISGSGSVTSSPEGIDCGSDCSEVFDTDQQVTLTAVAAADYSFFEWTGACAGNTEVCSLELATDQQTTAVFSANNIQVLAKLLDVEVTDHTGNGDSAAKVRSGIPFPKGLLAESDFVSVYDGGLLLPTQTKTLSLWDDGSVRWLLFDTEVALNAGETKTLTINKINAANTAVNNPIEIEESNELFTVSTGGFSVEIPKLNGAIIHRALLDNQVIIEAPIDPMTDRGAYISMFDSSDSSTTNFFSGLLKSDSSPKAGSYFKEYEDSVSASGNSTYNRYDPFDLQVEIEEQGSMHSVIKISGAHLDTSGNGFSTFIVRLHFYAGKSSIKVAHTIVYTGDETQQIAGYGLKLPMISSGSSTVIEGETIASGNGELLHTEFRNYLIDGDQSSGQALGYVGRSKNNVSMSLVLRDMAERFPKALTANDDGLEIQLYPSSQSPWDLTRYTPLASETDASSGLAAEIATREGETNRFTNHYFLRGAQGLSTTDDYLIDFASGALDTAKLEDIATTIDQGPSVMVADAKWYSDALVMGVGPFYFDTSLANSEGAYRIDKVLQINRDFMRYNQRIKFDWFGIEDYGDIRGKFAGSRQTSATWSTRGRYGWSGNSGEPSNQLWVQYLRQPSHQTFLDAEALARHTMDQQTVHFATSTGQAGTELDGRNMFSSVGSVHRHGVQSWSGYAGNPDYSHIAGIETYYYLTGDQRAKEVIYEQAQFITRDTLGRTALRNGLDVVDRAAAVFFDDSNLLAEFEEKIDFFVDYMNSHPDGFNYNAVEAYLIDIDGNGVHDRTQGIKTNRQMFQAGFEYFMRSAPGLLYRHERTGDSVVGRLILDAADILTKGDPNNQNGDGDDWDLGLDGHAGSYFYHMNSIAYAAFIAESLGESDADYYALAKLCAEVNTHGGNDNNDTSPISLSTFQAIPDDWTKWNWLWQTNSNFDTNNPGILWLDRMIMYQNDTIQDYHSYRAFIHLATAAAIVKPGDQLELK
ncbi:MAG: InlB B-repeat-containing protein [Kangiellaceae bacterium]